DCFFDHFRRLGFRVREPDAKMMVAVFDTQAGFESYLGVKLPSGVTGLYHPDSNRLVVYDIASNDIILAAKKHGEQQFRRVRDTAVRSRTITAFNRKIKDITNDVNIGTVMHEVAHQLSFNCGLLNRKGDVSCWLAEGLACYCEPAINGAWQGI